MSIKLLVNIDLVKCFRGPVPQRTTMKTTRCKFICLFILSFVCIEIFGEENLYDVLGVRKTATQKEIKQAYRNQAMEW